MTGFVELENFIGIHKNTESDEPYKKCELRNRTQLRYGTDAAYLLATANLYAMATFLSDRLGREYRYSEKDTVHRNLRISSKYYEASFNELYASYDTDRVRLRAGNQIYGWGTADVYNPTSYFNPFDMREYFFKDEDEQRLGLPSVSAMFFIGDFTLETVLMPVHVPMALAPSGNFWAIESKLGRQPVILEEGAALDAKPENMGAGARFAGSVMGVDVSLSAYHGPYKEPLLVPDGTRILPNKPLALAVKQQYHVLTMIGTDVSFKMDKFVLQAEAAYSPDKTGMVMQDTDDIRRIAFPFETRKSPYVSYSAGFNYFIPLGRLIEGHEGDTVFTAEWHQSLYLDRELADPLFTKIVSCRLEDSYLGGRLKVSLTAMFDTAKSGYLLWPQLTWDFQNGLSFSVTYAAIEHTGASTGRINENESAFYYLRDNDMVTWRVRYAYK